MDEARLSALWREASHRYVTAVNAYVERGLRDGWEKAGPEPQDDRADLAAEVLAIVRAANARGNTGFLRERFPPAWEPFSPIIEKVGQQLAPLAWIDDRRIAAKVGGVGPVVVVDEDEIVEQPNVRSFGRSSDGRFFALAFDEGVEVRRGWNGPKVALLDLPNGQEGLPAGRDAPRAFKRFDILQLVVFPDGCRVLLASSAGVFVLSASGTTRLIPTPAEYGEQADSWSKKLLDASPGSLSMVHGAVSPRGYFVLAGWQGSRHLVFDEQLEQVASVGPLCEYPDFAWFSTTGDLAAFNACSFYDGVSIAVPATALRGLDTAHHEKHPSVRVLDESARVYAAVARDDEFIIGDARGYLRAFDLRGNYRWQYFIGSTISALDLSPDGKKLAVASYAGSLCVLELDAAERDPFAIGTASHRELVRWLFWKGEDRALKW
jgi:hypothetical protein